MFRHLSMACAAQHGICIDERQYRRPSKLRWLMQHIHVAVIGGGQSGLAAAHALLRRGLRPVVLEASDRAAGPWPHCYDSLTLFSPARRSSPPGMSFPGADRDRYPHRDEVVAYLTAYAQPPGRRDPHRLPRHRSRPPHAPVTGLRRAGSMCANIDVCRIPGCCRCSIPPTARVWRRAARR